MAIERVIPGAGQATARGARPTSTAPPAARSAAKPGSAGRRTTAADPVSVVLFSLAAFAIILALLATELKSTQSPQAASRTAVLRKIYRTRVIETVIGASAVGGTSVSQSVSSSGSVSASAAPITRTS